MKRLVCVPLLLALAAAGCKKKEPIRVQQTEEEAGALASVVHVADPQATPQLLKGFHAVEQNAWRWTMGKFSVALRPPANAGKNGAVLNLKFSVPEPIVAKLKTVSLSAIAGGQTLSPETYTQAGEFTYTRDIAAKELAGEAVNIEFSLDKFLAAGEADQRELGVVVSSVGLEPK